MFLKGFWHCPSRHHLFYNVFDIIMLQVHRCYEGARPIIVTSTRLRIDFVQTVRRPHIASLGFAQSWQRLRFQWTTQSTTQSSTLSTTQSNSQSFTQPSTQSTIESTIESTIQSTVESATQSTIQFWTSLLSSLPCPETVNLKTF